jgi:hypothetical protein
MSHGGELVCANCFNESSISGFITRHAEPDECSFCGSQEGPVAELDDVVKFMAERISREYGNVDEEGAPWDPEDQEYFPTTYRIEDIFEIEFGGAPILLC